MNEHVAVSLTIDANGQMILPPSVRSHLHLPNGGGVKLFMRPDGTVVLLAARPIAELYGSLKYDGPRLTQEDEEQAMVEGMVERDRQSRK